MSSFPQARYRNAADNFRDGLLAAPRESGKHTSSDNMTFSNIDFQPGASTNTGPIYRGSDVPLPTPRSAVVSAPAQRGTASTVGAMSTPVPTTADGFTGWRADNYAQNQARMTIPQPAYEHSTPAPNQPMHITEQQARMMYDVIRNKTGFTGEGYDPATVFHQKMSEYGVDRGVSEGLLRKWESDQSHPERFEIPNTPGASPIRSGQDSGPMPGYTPLPTNRPAAPVGGGTHLTPEQLQSNQQKYIARETEIAQSTPTYQALQRDKAITQNIQDQGTAAIAKAEQTPPTVQSATIRAGATTQAAGIRTSQPRAGSASPAARPAAPMSIAELPVFNKLVEGGLKPEEAMQKIYQARSSGGTQPTKLAPTVQPSSAAPTIQNQKYMKYDLHEGMTPRDDGGVDYQGTVYDFGSDNQWHKRK